MVRFFSLASNPRLTVVNCEAHTGNPLISPHRQQPLTNLAVAFELFQSSTRRREETAASANATVAAPRTRLLLRLPSFSQLLV
ncbi:hypothetical protein EJ110_NYTH06138 [Nymphaea thermarum]|nr:hypothetical protein EJ110_NYTH06138 [Nymphaea thermarum]